MDILFVPSVVLLINVAIKCYDKVFSQSKDKKTKQPLPDVTQAMDDIPAVINDFGKARELFEKYGADPNFKGPDDVSYELVDPTWKQTKTIQNSVHKYLRLNPDLMIALIWFFAGHGVIADGKQCILINDFDAKL